ncbi:hypothetical protein [Nitrosovibrio sp. Nv6]|uniref:hypothetical protein n=1 Tax=Nitrosovibrio sp. Nv6 TaxID=1855340 RepID=UPI0008C6D822|nr:hypothetical protein [Nitrosovibrio sp. Nv6]SEO77160.1 hypothetical protein SAMN05216316_1047 [Nitrosovibrio sp. Nv6]
MPFFVTYIILPIVILLAGFGGGWTVHGWKTDAQITKMEERVRIADAANAKCATDIGTVQAGVKEVTGALVAKEKAAAAAMKDAQYWAAQHSRLAEEVNTYQARPGETQCQTIEREQKEYVQNRSS